MAMHYSPRRTLATGCRIVTAMCDKVGIMQTVHWVGMSATLPLLTLPLLQLLLVSPDSPVCLFSCDAHFRHFEHA